MKDYSVSSDDKRVAFAMKDEKGISHVWIAPTDHRGAPLKLDSEENEDSPVLLPNGDVLYRVSHGGKNYVYKRRAEGGEEKPVMEEAILELVEASPDGKWVVVSVSDNQNPDHPYRTVAYPTEAGPQVTLCRMLCAVEWDTNEAHMVMNLFKGKNGIAYFVPTEKGTGLPKLGAEGVGGSEDLQKFGKTEIVEEMVDSAVSPEVYAFTRVTVRRNLYRIPVK